MKSEKMNHEVDGAAPGQSDAAQGSVAIPFVCRYGQVEVEGILISYPPGEGETDIYFLHPLTGQKMERVRQILQGWSEQDESAQSEWVRLVEEIEDDDLLEQRIWDGHDEESPVVVDYTPECSGA